MNTLAIMVGSLLDAAASFKGVKSAASRCEKQSDVRALSSERMRNEKRSYGLDASNATYVDLVEKGIIDRASAFSSATRFAVLVRRAVLVQSRPGPA
jgi:chaperonin GroEL (HSP60 family)